MRKGSVLIMAVLAAALLSCCGGSDLFKNMSLKDSAFLLYYAEDNSSFTVSYLYQGDDLKKKFLSDLSTVKAAPVENWSFSDITFPVYGFSLFDSDRFEKYYAWSNDILYTPDGRKYKFKFDFDKIRTTYPFAEENTFTGFQYFPQAKQMMLDDTGWNQALLVPGQEPAKEHDVALEVVGLEDQKLTARFTNQMNDLFVFGEYYSIQVLLDDGAWYNVPPESAWAVHDLAYELSPGQSYDMTYSLEPYGKLPAGRYRILGGGLGDGSFTCAAEFDLT